MSHEFTRDAIESSNRRNREWYHKNLPKVLKVARKNRVRDIDTSIALAEKLVKILDEPLPKYKPVPFYPVEKTNDLNLMKPIDPKDLDMFYGSTEKGGAKRYLQQRQKMPPEDRFYVRLATSWDYGWKQKQAKQSPYDVHHGRCLVMKHSCYRPNNVGPDPKHYGVPASGNLSTCN